MPRKKNDPSLLQEWEKVKDTMRQKDFARQHGMTVKALEMALYKQRIKETNREPEHDQDTTEKINITQDGPYTFVESRSLRIKTLEDLVQACQIDLKKYSVERWTANKWEVGVKQTDGTVLIEPLFQVKANLIPIHPEPVHITLKPVSIGSSPIRIPKTAHTRGRGLVIPDTQIGFRKNQTNGRLDPFHDRAAMDVALQIAQQNEYTDITWLGDVLDLNDWSDKFLKEPEFYFTTQPAIYEAHWWMAQFRKASPKARIKKIEGNHEYRMPKMLITHLLAAHGLSTAQGIRTPVLSVETLLGLSGLGIEYLGNYPHNEDWMGPVKLIHGDVAKSGTTDTVKAVSAHAEETVIQGHIHKIEMASRTIRSRHGIRTISAYSAGCLCRIDYVVPGHKHPQQWQQGACEVEWHGEDFQITPIVIQDGRAIHRGKVYQARDVVPLLNKDTEQVRDQWSFT